MFKLIKLLSLSTALSILQVSAQNDMEDSMTNDMASLGKIIECIDMEGSSIVKDDCTCNDIKGIVDMPIGKIYVCIYLMYLLYYAYLMYKLSVAAAPFEEAGLPLDLFTKCCPSEDTTNEEFTECTAKEVDAGVDVDSLADQIPDSDSLSEVAAGSEDAGEEAPSDTDTPNTDEEPEVIDETTETDTDELIEEEEEFFGEEENSGMNNFGSSSLVVLGMGTILACLF